MEAGWKCSASDGGLRWYALGPKFQLQHLKKKKTNKLNKKGKELVTCFMKPAGEELRSRDL